MWKCVATFDRALLTRIEFFPFEQLVRNIARSSYYSALLILVAIEHNNTQYSINGFYESVWIFISLLLISVPCKSSVVRKKNTHTPRHAALDSFVRPYNRIERTSQTFIIIRIGKWPLLSFDFLIGRGYRLTIIESDGLSMRFPLSGFHSRGRIVTNGRWGLHSKLHS